ncbi:MAG: DUF2939 domain-containing protein [Alphaproteobacteria bacterium]|nr:DUF2939 domain-containing protein [Alphaproteobacteria bacterium]
MRRSLVLFGVLACAAYIVWPFHTAWSVREAVKSGNSSYLAKHFEWGPVKKTLKDSMTEMVLGPIEASLEGKPRRKGLWASFKSYYGRTAVNSIVERYANPSGLPTLFSYGRTVRTNVLGRKDPDEGLSLPARIASAWNRLDRAAFVSLTRFEIDMRDKYEPTRVYAGVMELKDWRWKVVELRVRQRQAAPTALRFTSAASTAR